MRTTLTLDADVARLIERAVHERRSSMKDVVNDAIRRGLRTEQPERPYSVDVHHSGLVVGVDAGRLNQLADELDDEAAMGASRR